MNIYRDALDAGWRQVEDRQLDVTHHIESYIRGGESVSFIADGDVIVEARYNISGQHSGWTLDPAFALEFVQRALHLIP